MKTSLALVLVLLPLVLFSQTKQESALKRGEIAINLMDNGKIDESIVILKECMADDPSNYIYPYEIAYAYTLKGDHKNAMTYYKKSTKYKNATSQSFQGLGNAYSYSGDPEKAIKTYETGIKRFPNAGNLHLEKGNIFLMQKAYDQAAKNYKNGIIANPLYPSNYYRLATLYLSSKDILAGTIYAEIFMNLEPNTERSTNLGKYFFNAFKDNIIIETINADSTKINIKMCDNTIYIDPKFSNADNFLDAIPLCLYWGTSFTLALTNETEISIESLNRIRTNFVEHYFKEDNKLKKQNVLFDFYKKVYDAGHFEAYNYYIFRNVDEDTFDNWITGNKDKFEDFVTWANEPQNQIDLSKSNYYINK